MSHDFIFQVLDEIALEGLDGITLNSLWVRLKHRKDFTLSLDDKSKAYLWKSFAGHSDLQFFELPEPRLPFEFINRFDFCDIDGGFWIEASLGPNIYPINIVHGADVQGSCDTFNTRKEVTDEITDRNWTVKMSLDEVMSRWGEKLAVVASQSLRTATLLGPETKSSLRLEDIEYCLLERIARARENGEVTTLSQESGSLGVFNMESKKLFYHCKKLIRMKLMTKQVFVIRDVSGRQTSCRLMLMKRFYARRISRMRQFLEDVCRYLEGKQQQMEVTSIVKEELDIQDVSFKRLLKDKSHFTVLDVPYRELYPDATPDEFLTKSNRLERNLKVIKLIKSLKYDNDDEDNDDEDDEDSKELTDKPWIYERPVLQQAMMHVVNAGERGIKQTKLRSLMNLGRLECRTIVRNLQKFGCVTSVMKSFGKHRTAIFIACKFLGKCDLTQEFDKEKSRLIEHMQDDSLLDRTVDQTLDQTSDQTQAITDMEVSQTEESVSAAQPDDAGDAKKELLDASSTSTATVTPHMRAVKRKLSSDSMETSPAPKKLSKMDNDFLAMKNLTAMKLRRANLVLDSLKETKVYENGSVLFRTILAAEAEKGYTEKMDRKTFKKLLNWLKVNNKIKTIRTAIQNQDKVTELEFICAPEIQPNDEIIKTFIEHAKMKRFGIKKSHRAHQKEAVLPPDLPESLRDSIMKFREYRSKMKISHMVYDPYAFAKYNFLPKVKRFLMMHKYLHYLLCTYDGQLLPKQEVANPEDIDVQEFDDIVTQELAALKEPPVFVDDDSWKRYVAPLQTNHDHGEGWCLLSDVMVLMPLSIYCNVVSLPYRIKGLKELLEHPHRRHYPVVCLPPSIREQVLFARRYTTAIYECCYHLCLMGLLSFGPSVFRDKDKCFLYLHQKGMLLDTRTSSKAHSMTWIEPGKHFTKQYYLLNSEESVATYWADLELIAINSNLGHKGLADHPGEVEGGIPLGEAIKSIRFEEPHEPPYLPGNRRGAVGFDSSLYIHLTRNWSRPKDFKKKKPESHGAFVAKKALQRLKSKQQIKIKEVNEGGKIKFTSSSIKQRLPRLIPQPQLSSMGPLADSPAKTTTKVMGNRGGKGIKRKQAAAGAKKVREKILMRRHLKPDAAKDLLVKKKKQKIPKRKAKFDATDREAIKLMVNERVHWTPREDTIVLLCKTASLLLAKSQRGLIVPWSVVRDILHEAVPSSRDKAAPAVQRRVSFALKNPQTLMSVSIYLGEALQDKELKEKFGYRRFRQSDPNMKEIFRDCVNMLIAKFTSDDQEKIILPAHLTELTENYNIKELDMLTEKWQAKEVTKEKDVYYYTVHNLIHSYIASQRDKQGRTEEMYHLFKQYPDELLIEVFSDMNSQGLITKIKNDPTSGARRRQFVTAVSHKKLTQKYYYAFHSRFPPHMFTQGYAMLDKLVHAYTEGDVDGLLLKQNELVGGYVATVLGLFALKKVNFGLRIPEEILKVDTEAMRMIPLGRGKTPAQDKSADASIVTDVPTEEAVLEESIVIEGDSMMVPASEMEVVSEVEVSASTASVLPGTSTEVSEVAVSTGEVIQTNPVPVGLTVAADPAPNLGLNLRNYRSLIVMEGEVVPVDEGLLAKLDSKKASRSLISMARNKIIAEDYQCGNVQDHFVINACEVKVALNLGSTSPPAGDGKLTEKEFEETKTLFLKTKKAKELYRKHLQYFPFRLDLNEVWEDLGREYGLEDVVMIRKVHNTISEAGPVGLRESALKNEYKAVCNISLVIMVLLEQKAMNSDIGNRHQVFSNMGEGGCCRTEQPYFTT